VVPEAGGDLTERRILSGEPPDPSRIPPGCRFHPRCPAVASGEAASAGIEERCFGEVPPLYDVGAGHVGACHLLDRRA
jgi:ABC-type dipeptide/oligopeptide/nickel transport system ATPase component